MSEKRSPDSRSDFGAYERVKDFIEHALEPHGRAGDWLPDPLLEEIAEMRRGVLAKHGNDYRRVWESYIERDPQAAAHEAQAGPAGKQKRSAA